MSNSKDFNGKVVLVTGSSGGIGAAIVTYLAKCGAQVVVNGRNADNVAKVAQQCNNSSQKSKRL
jgi:gluconate 5-dehydrogenase